MIKKYISFFMMKKIFVSLLFFLFLSPSLAKDACTNPSEYTVDKRCYVTDQQKKQKPYNAVVMVYNKNKRCTGTIVKKDGKLYLYTAKHCVIDDLNAPVDKIKSESQDGKIFEANKKEVGDLYEEKQVVNGVTIKRGFQNYSGDWAFYTISEKELNSVNISNKHKFGVGPFTLDYDARVIGYGALKIMSDKEIQSFKEKYIKYLKEKVGIEATGKEKMLGFYENGVWVDFPLVSYFLQYLSNNENSYYNEFFENGDVLKVSYCEYSSNGKDKNCQVWKGNSGGGIFDDEGNIMGIFTGNKSIIGGANHGGAQDVWFDKETKSILLLK